MKVYVGIRQTNSHIYMAALNSHGKTILKTHLPSSCPPQAIVNTLEAFQQAFRTHLRIITCLEKDLQHSLY